MTRWATPPEEAPDRTAEAAPEATREVSTPVEATLRILGSSVPYLIGAAVVRSAGTVAAEVGRVPWLFDRRLTRLELSDDALPPNQAVLLDWPVPHQAEWVGAPPRLLIARLVAFDRTVGALLGTLITRDQLESRTREAVELSCQLIASSVATETLVREAEQQSRRLRVLNELQRQLSTSLDARALGRILREAVGYVMEHVTFSVSLFHPQRAEVAYRYRAVETDALASELARQPLDDGPDCRAARRAEPVVFAREVGVPLPGEPLERTLRRQVNVVQFPLLQAEAAIGIVTVQAVRPEGYGVEELELAKAIIDTSANYFSHARRIGLRRPEAEEPRFTLVTGTGPVAPAREGAPVAPDEGPAAAPAALPSATERDTERVLADLLELCAALEQPHAFAVLADPGAGLMRGHLHSRAPFMEQLDEAAGIGRGTFVIGIDDRTNAIARACREARVVAVAWMYEVLQPIVTWQDALVLERLAGGGRCTVIPIQVAGEAAGAVVVGPCAEDVPEATLRRLVPAVEAAGRELAEVWRAASLRGDAHLPLIPEATVLRLSALREPGPGA